MSLLTRNYFRVGDEFKGERRNTAQYHFFDDEDLTQTENAYASALRDATVRHERLCMFRPPRHEGPWDDVQIIGHRSLRVLNADHQSSETMLERDALASLVLRRRALPEVG